MSVRNKHFGIERTYTCAKCSKTFKHWSAIEAKVFTCDECTAAICATNVQFGELLKFGIHRSRAEKFGWKPEQPECPICHALFVRSNYNQLYCKRPGCLSHGFNGRTKKIVKTYDDTGEDPRKIVVCDAMQPCFDAMSRSFPGVVTKDEFDETRKAVMADSKGDYVKPSAMAAAIFYVIGKMKDSRNEHHPSQAGVSKVVGVTDVTVRKYIMMVKKSVEDREL